MKSLHELEKEMEQAITEVVASITVQNASREYIIGVLRPALHNFVHQIRMLCIADTMQGIQGAFKKETPNDTTQPTSPPTHP